MSDNPQVPNPQVKVWNDTVGGAWVDYAEHFDAQLQPFGDAVLQRLELRGHERVVDIGCGAGATTVQLAGMTSEVLGIDISVPMLAMAERRAADASLANVRFAEHDVESAPFADGAFDVAYSRFGVMFFSDPVRAFTHLRQAMVDGGRLGFVCFDEPGKNPFMLVPVMAAASHLPMPPLPGPTDPSPFSMADTGRTTDLLTASGFGNVQIVPGPDSFTIGRSDDMQALARRALEQNPMSGAGMQAATADQQQAAIEATIEVLAPHARDGVITMPAKTWVVTAAAV